MSEQLWQRVIIEALSLSLSLAPFSPLVHESGDKVCVLPNLETQLPSNFIHQRADEMNVLWKDGGSLRSHKASGVQLLGSAQRPVEVELAKTLSLRRIRMVGLFTSHPGKRKGDGGSLALRKGGKTGDNIVDFLFDAIPIITLCRASGSRVELFVIFRVGFGCNEVEIVFRVEVQACSCEQVGLDHQVLRTHVFDSATKISKTFSCWEVFGASDDHLVHRQRVRKHGGPGHDSSETSCHLK